jgi:hypothetical protein
MRLAMLFNKKTKGIINAVWTVVAVLVILSMVLLYFPVFN